MAQQLRQRLGALTASDPASAERFQLEADLALVERRYNKAFYWLDRLFATGAPPDRAKALLAVALAGMESPYSIVEYVDVEADWAGIAEAVAAFQFWDAAEQYLRIGADHGAEVRPALDMARLAAKLLQMERARGYLDQARADGASETEIILLQQELGLGAGAGAVSLP